MAFLKMLSSRDAENIGEYVSGNIILKNQECIPADQLQDIQLIAEKEATKLMLEKSLGWDGIGELALSARAGKMCLLTTQIGKQVVFVARNRLSGKRVVITASGEIFRKIREASASSSVARYEDKSVMTPASYAAVGLCLLAAVIFFWVMVDSYPSNSRDCVEEGKTAHGWDKDIYHNCMGTPPDSLFRW